MLGGLAPSRSSTKGIGMSTDTLDAPSIPEEARLVRLCREVWDDHGYEIGKHLIAWALTLDHGPAITIEPANHRITVWDRLDEAVHQLDTFIDGPYNRYPLLPA